MRELKAAMLDFCFGVPKLAPFDKLHNAPSTCETCPYPGILFEISLDKGTFMYFFLGGGNQISF